MSRGRRAPSLITGSPTPDSSRFVPKVNETLRLEPYQVEALAALRRSRTTARITIWRRQLLAQVALDRERPRGRADKVLMTATA